MNCPICKNVDLKSSDFGEYGFIIVDICPNCQGAWFDKGEHGRLDESVWTDVEKVEFHKVSPDHKNAKCPKCLVDFEHLSPNDAKEEFIVDRCPSCEGFWLDKGELDKMKEVADIVDSETKENMVILRRPDDWSWLRWAIYLFKDCYFKKHGR